jgi:hypothetical protein
VAVIIILTGALSWQIPFFYVPTILDLVKSSGVKHRLELVPSLDKSAKRIFPSANQGVNTVGVTDDSSPCYGSDPEYGECDRVSDTEGELDFP